MENKSIQTIINYNNKTVKSPKKSYDPAYHKERKAKWYQANKEITINRAKEWEKKKKKKKREYNEKRYTEKIKCDNCGKETAAIRIDRHKKSKKCQNYKAN